MMILCNATMALLSRSRENFEARRNVQGFGSAFQHVVQIALRRLPGFEDVYINSGAGQPDIFNGQSGFEVKTTASDRIDFDGNYSDIRNQFLRDRKRFRIVILRVDTLPYRFWVVNVGPDSPATASLISTEVPGYESDLGFEAQLANCIKHVVCTSGTLFSDATSPTEVSNVLRQMFHIDGDLERAY
jgi:hypothetical protein